MLWGLALVGRAGVSGIINKEFLGNSMVEDRREGAMVMIWLASCLFANRVSASLTHV